jgi:SAM-dependent methyltransferase
VNRLMAEIREAVSRRELSDDTSLLESSATLRKMLADCENAISVEQNTPYVDVHDDFKPSTSGRYHLKDLLQYHDREFVRNAYRALLKREPDDTGYKQFLEGLRSGRLTKQDILVILRASPEGRNKAVSIDGLRFPVLRRQLYRLPGLRYLVQLLMGIARLPIMMRHHSQFQAYTIAEHQRLTEYTDQRNQELRQQVSDLVAELAASQRQIVSLQHQQIGSLFREQHELAEEQKLLRDEVVAQPSVEQVRIMIDQATTASTNSSTTQASAVPLTHADRQTIDEFYAAFENQFRGLSADITAGFKFYLPYLEDAGIQTDILDLGCGRGDWLRLLRDHKLEASGVEINPTLVEQCRTAGLKVVEDDILGYLRSLPKKSLSAVTGFHLIEHLPFETLILLINEIARVLKPKGLLIFESPNPENLVVAACNFYADPTHQRPVFPHTLTYLLGHNGFDNIRLEFLHPVEDSPYTDHKGVLQALDTWFYGPRDFAVIGSKI